MTAFPKINDTISSLQPYQPGTPIAEVARTLGISQEEIRKLASNENPRGPSKSVLAAITASIQDARLYPDAYEFTNKLAAHHGVNPNNILIGNGSNDVLDLIARTFLDSASEAIMYEHSFLVYKLASNAVGAKVIETPAHEFGYNLDAMLAAITEKTKVIWMDNPNNPTGTFIQHEQVKQFLRKVPASILVVLDEAYWDYLPDELRTDSMRWIDDFPNIIITRTFSKIHGLAALRVGYGVGHKDLIEPLNRLRQPFNVNSIGLAAATAAIQDERHILEEREANKRSLKKLTDGLDELSVPYIASFTNFVTAKFNNSSTIHQRLLEEGIIVRPISNYGLGDFLRITAGNEMDVDALLVALAKIHGKKLT